MFQARSVKQRNDVCRSAKIYLQEHDDNCYIKTKKNIAICTNAGCLFHAWLCLVPNHKPGNKAKIKEFSKEFRIHPPVNINSIVMFKSNAPTCERSLEDDFDDAIEKARSTSSGTNAHVNEFDKVIGNLKS
jgi:hypothetical protein